MHRKKSKGGKGNVNITVFKVMNSDGKNVPGCGKAFWNHGFG